PGVTYVPNVEYECVDGVSRVLQILVPRSRNAKVAEAGGAAPQTHPCVVYVQGSAWMEQNVYANIPCIARLADRGFVVAIVQYRESSVAGFPAPIQDTRNAVRFMRVHAAEYAVDPARMAVMGDSSGGHTAVYAGILHDDDEPANLFPGVSGEVNCIVNYYGSTDLTFDDSNPSTPNHNMPDSPEGMEMGGFNLRKNRAKRELLSVRCNIDKDTDIAPVLTLHGTKDRIVNTRCSVLLHQRLAETGHESRLYLLRGADHGGPEFWTPEVLDLVEDFLREYV
ncbi:MAG: alpha/beta hydrolase, partial [Atopobiaceae bacterium]|nr:alpha/beta hydrolase [Atopobiaceae bacterium]